MANDIPSGLVTKVRQLAANDVRYVAVFREMAERAQKRTVVDLYRMKLSMGRGGISFTDVDFLKLFEAMERAGAGTLTVRPQPDHSTFQFRYTMQELAKRVLAGLQTGDAGVLARGVAGSPKNSIRVVYELNGAPVALNLPANFSLKDADKLGAYLKTVAKMNESGSL